MSRIGKQSIILPNTVTLDIQPNQVIVNGPKGQLIVNIPAGINIEINEENVLVKRKSDNYKALHGLVRSLLANAITGVDKGFEKKLELHGVGYKAALDGNGLNLSLGFSHPIKYEAKEGIGFKIEKNTIIVTGIDKQKVGQVCAEIRSYRKPEPYKGKGIRYSDEIVRRKAGKAAKGATS
jgi:large subunit ribosomal protein L6